MKKNFNEVWKQIEDYPDYSVSNLGRLFCLKENRILEGCIWKKKKFVGFNGKIYLLHRIVAKAFPDICGKWFEGCEVHHLDKNPLNNRADNLKVCTKEEHYAYHHDDRVEAGKKLTGVNNPMFGKKHSEETRKKMSDAHRGENNHNYGKPRSEEVRRKISIAKKRRYAAMTDGERERHNEIIRKSREHLKKPVLQYTLDGEFIKEWDSLMQIERTLGYYNSNISACCKGKLKTCHGFLWRYKSDVENNE